jgi:hypothetical protein
MRFIIATAALLLSLLPCLAQTFPGQFPPGALYGNPTASPAPPTVYPLIGNNTAPIAADGKQLIVQNSAVTQGSIFNPITGGVVYDNFRSVIDIPPSSTALSANAYGGYVQNRSGTGAVFGAGVIYYGLTTCITSSSNCWGENYRLEDSPDGLGHGLTAAVLNGSELDYYVTNTGTTIQGVGLQLGGIVQPTFAGGFSCSSDPTPITNITGSASPYTLTFSAATFTVGTVLTIYGVTPASLNGSYTVTASSAGSLTATTAATGTYASGGSITGPHFTYCGFSLDGASQTAYQAGAITAPAANIGSQFVNFVYYNASAAGNAWQMNADANGNFRVASTEGSTGKIFFVNGTLASPTAMFSGTIKPIVTVQTTGANPAFMDIIDISGTQQVGIELCDVNCLVGTDLKWQLVKQTDGSFNIFDAVALADAGVTVFKVGVNSGPMFLTPNNLLNLNPTGGFGVSVGGAANPGSTNLAVAGRILNPGIPTSAGAGGLNVCVDTAGVFYKKATCP